jgi:cytochrome oxidase Cu insertion factor (SCO1/SenC/PrrC family)
MTEATPLSSADERGTPVDRAAAFAAGPSRIPRNFWYVVLGVAAVLGIGGALLEHLLSVVGLNPTAAAVTTTTRPRPGSSAGKEHEAAVAGKLASFIGLTSMTPGGAHPFSLLDERGSTISLSSYRGKVVVITFFDGRCDDICPVLGAEIRQAATDLGARAREVSFLTVNTDPAATAVSALDRALSMTKLGVLPNWHMLTGPLSELNSVWQSYGISVTYDTATHTVAHNDTIYFLDTQGRFVYGASPFANESRPSGTFVLPRAEITRFALGIATYAARILDR